MVFEYFYFGFLTVCVSFRLWEVRGVSSTLPCKFGVVPQNREYWV